MKRQKKNFFIFFRSKISLEEAFALALVLTVSFWFGSNGELKRIIFPIIIKIHWLYLWKIDLE